MLPPTLARRTLLAAAPVAAVATLLRADPAAAQIAPPFTLPALPYDYAALEPVIDRETMVLHHDKHHQAYVDGLNKAVADQPRLRGMTLEAMLADLQAVPEPARGAVRNMGGGHLNHSLFWRMMRPGGSVMPDMLRARLTADFGSPEAMQARFEEAGLKQFGSGWAFLAYDTKAKRTEVLSLPNQDAVVNLDGKVALLGNDVWEHAYYLTYRNRRADYLHSWWRVVDWPFVTGRLADAQAGRSQT